MKLCTNTFASALYKWMEAEIYFCSVLCNEHFIPNMIIKFSPFILFCPIFIHRYSIRCCSLYCMSIIFIFYLNSILIVSPFVPILSLYRFYACCIIFLCNQCRYWWFALFLYLLILLRIRCPFTRDGWWMIVTLVCLNIIWCWFRYFFSAFCRLDCLCFYLLFFKCLNVLYMHTGWRVFSGTVKQEPMFQIS